MQGFFARKTLNEIYLFFETEATMDVEILALSQTGEDTLTFLLAGIIRNFARGFRDNAVGLEEALDSMEIYLRGVQGNNLCPSSSLTTFLEKNLGWISEIRKEFGSLEVIERESYDLMEI